MSILAAIGIAYAVLAAVELSWLLWQYRKFDRELAERPHVSKPYLVRGQP